MVWLLRLEFFKLRHNPQLLALIAAIFILGVFAAGSKFSNLPQEYEEPGSDIPLYAAEQDFFQPAYSDETSYLRYVNSVYQTSFLTLDAFYDYINGEFITDIVFPDIMGNSMITYAAAFLLPFFYLLRDFKNRALNGSITSGFPRRSILRTRVIFYFVLIMFVELLITLTALTFYGKSWSSLLPASHIIRCLVMKLLLVCGTMSVPLCLFFLIKKPVLSAAVSAVYSVICVYFNRHISDSAENLICFFPPSIQSIMPVWRTGTPCGILLQAIIWPSLFITLATILSYRSFRRIDWD